MTFVFDLLFVLYTCSKWTPLRADFVKWMTNTVLSETCFENTALKFQRTKSNRLIQCDGITRVFLCILYTLEMFFCYANQHVWPVLCIPAAGANWSLNRCCDWKARASLLSWTALACLRAVELHPLAPVWVFNHGVPSDLVFQEMLFQLKLWIRKEHVHFR